MKNVINYKSKERVPFPRSKLKISFLILLKIRNKKYNITTKIQKVEPERQILANKVLSLHVSICMSQMETLEKCCPPWSHAFSWPLGPTL
jgi:hypothetical protein